MDDHAPRHDVRLVLFHAEVVQLVVMDAHLLYCDDVKISKDVLMGMIHGHPRDVLGHLVRGLVSHQAIKP